MTRMVLTNRRNWTDYSPAFDSAMRSGLKLQLVLGVSSFLLLCTGNPERTFAIAFLVQWTATWIILFRRPMNPTEFDLTIVRKGIAPLWLSIHIFGPVIRPLILNILGISSS